MGFQSMRIVHFLNHARQANGHVCLAVDLACEQARQGHEVYFVSGHCDFTRVIEENGVNYIPIPEVSSRPKQLWKLWKSLMEVSGKVQPDIVNAHMVASALSAKAAQLFSGFKLVTTVHNSFDPQAKYMGVGDRVIAVSQSVKSEMISKGISQKKLRVVKNGTIGGARRPLRSETEVQLSKPAIATVAGLHPRKGIADLVDAFDIVTKTHKEANLYIIGEGPMRAEYEERARALECGDQVHFLGFLEDPQSILASVDIFVLASHAEPFGLVLLEAREMGCALIGTKVGGIPEVLHQGEIGVLVEAQSPQKLGMAISELLADEARLNALKKAASTDLEECTVAYMSEQTMKVYRELVKADGSSRNTANN